MLLCCDGFDVLVGSAGGFVLGCLVTGILAKTIILEQARKARPMVKRTEWKSQQGEWK